MLKIYINNIELFVKPNSTVLEACETIGIEIPRFCYHEILSIAGNCRMCLVEVEKSLKPVVSCAMPVMNGMRIFTDTPLVKKAREGVLEFLLLNHPLDCPICDQAGECDLQDQVMLFGNDRSRFYSFKRVVEDKNIGLLIKTIMTRCIHCTRCVRFAAEIAGIEDLGTTSRGTHTEIGTYIEKLFQSELSGNVIDLCPVGALTSKPYAFTSRPWELKVSESIDISDGVGSNIRIDFKETEIIRILPRFHEEINSEWISNKARFSFDGVKHNRLSKPYVSIKTPFFKKFQSSNWEFSLSKIASNINKVSNENIVGVCGLSADLETQLAFKEFINSLGSEKVGFEKSLNICKDFSFKFKFNKGFSSIQKADLCLLIGTNPRYEGSLLNVHLRKRFLEGKFKVASVGIPLNLTYPIEHLGLGTKMLKKIFLQGENSFVSEFKKAKHPLIIVGSSILKRNDSKKLIFFLETLKNNFDISFKLLNYINNNDALSLLSNESNQVGSLELGLSSVSKNTLTGANLLHLIAIDYYTAKDLLKLCNKSCFIVYQNSHGNSLANIANILLPTTTFVERVGTYINTEGRTQKTVKVLNVSDLSRDDYKIFVTLAYLVKTNLSKNLTTQISLLIPSTNSVNTVVLNKRLCVSENTISKWLKVKFVTYRNYDMFFINFKNCFKSLHSDFMHIYIYEMISTYFFNFKPYLESELQSVMLTPRTANKLFKLNYLFGVIYEEYSDLNTYKLYLFCSNCELNIQNTKFNSIIEDFYLTSTLTRSSYIMSECSKSLFKNRSNFTV